MMVMDSKMYTKKMATEKGSHLHQFVTSRVGATKEVLLRMVEHCKNVYNKVRCRTQKKQNGGTECGVCSRSQRQRRTRELRSCRLPEREREIGDDDGDEDGDVVGE